MYISALTWVGFSREFNLKNIFFMEKIDWMMFTVVEIDKKVVFLESFING